MRLASGEFRGRPLTTLLFVLSVWVGLRVVTWAPLVEPLQNLGEFASSKPATMRSARPVTGERQVQLPDSIYRDRAEGLNAFPKEGVASGSVKSTVAPLDWADTLPAPIARPERRIEPDVAAGHQLLWLAAMSRLPSPGHLISQHAPAGEAKSLNAAQADAARWSLDAWAFWRDGSHRLSSDAGRSPVYGASQLGAVMRYRLAPSSSHDPRAYVRAYKALVTDGESELAAGLSARPVGQLPLRAHAELRATRFARSTEIRPAAFVTTELPQKELGLGVRGEVYAQAGYVGGEGATAFADGQLHLMKGVSEFDLGKISVGGASWAGAQEGSNRLDIGPSMRLDIEVGGTPARVSVDWRERVAGNAEPGSGVAVTLSTRF